MSDWEHAKLPTLYSKARKALAACSTVDECQEWKNKSVALASYARQTNDTELLDRATEIINRARRRQSEILSGVKRKPGPGRPTKNSTRKAGNVSKGPGRAATAKAAGMSTKEVEVAHRVGKMPEKEFEANVKKPNLGKPTRKKYVRPSSFIDAVKVIADARAARAVEPEEMDGVLVFVEKALKNLTKFAIALKQRKPMR